MNSIDDPKFHVLDYVIMVLFLVISSAIGIYYGFYKKQTTPEEYLLGGRQMNLLPVAMSLVVTYQSAVSVLGIPMEHYVYTTMSDYLWVAIMADNAIQALLLVPLFYPLRLTSTYEYFGRRFKSRAVQLLGTIMGMLQTLLYMAIVLLAPALALEAVAGIPLWLSVVMVGIIGTFYTSIGGLRTVIWTDVFQFIILYGGLLVILILVTTLASRLNDQSNHEYHHHHHHHQCYLMKITPQPTQLPHPRNKQGRWHETYGRNRHRWRPSQFQHMFFFG
ncbi:SC5A8-like protein [Mya arenaria]|uniref:SC5A8-like protein n=1 Tax=Mya arenaria TaxID=6604 RepID=A0ABY7FDI8_MYAAR|nr:SC5A8-like protein [Mya arenaria]